MNNFKDFLSVNKKQVREYDGRTKEGKAMIQRINAKREAKLDELTAKQKKYQDFFRKALKKFGVESPAELDQDKKIEFFNYVDANYEADNEED